VDTWQVFILITVFGWVKPDGKRRFCRTYIEVPHGNAKSTLSSALALYMLAADGEGGAEVYSLATTRDQARIVFGDAQTMARQSSGFRTRFGCIDELHAHKTRTVYDVVETGTRQARQLALVGDHHRRQQPFGELLRDPQLRHPPARRRARGQQPVWHRVRAR
jgi:phage terminase large subunit-like protein